MSKIAAEIEVRARTYDRTARNPEATFNARARVYFFHEGENMLQNLCNRNARPSTLYKTWLPDIAEQMGLPRTTKFRWSQKAGCQCGCSPGFICDDAIRKDVFVTLRGAPVVHEAEAAARVPTEVAFV